MRSLKDILFGIALFAAIGFAIWWFRTQKQKLR